MAIMSWVPLRGAPGSRSSFVIVTRATIPSSLSEGSRLAPGSVVGPAEVAAVGAADGVAEIGGVEAPVGLEVAGTPVPHAVATSTTEANATNEDTNEGKCFNGVPLGAP